MIQSCGRLCGRNKGKSHLDLHTTKETADALYSGFHFTNEVINRAIASPFYSGDMEEDSFAESVKAVKMNKKKMPIKRSMTTKVKVLKREWALVSGNDSGVPLDEYKYKNPQEQDEGEEESKEEGKQEESKEGEPTADTEEEQGLERLYNSLRRAISRNRQTVAIKVLKFFYTSRATAHTKADIKKNCEIETNFKHYTEWTSAHGRYCLLLETQQGWKLNPVVVERVQELLPQIYNM